MYFRTQNSEDTTACCSGDGKISVGLNVGPDFLSQVNVYVCYGWDCL